MSTTVAFWVAQGSGGMLALSGASAAIGDWAVGVPLFVLGVIGSGMARRKLMEPVTPEDDLRVLGGTE